MRKKLSFLFTIIAIIALFSNFILKNQKPFNLYKLNFKDSLVIDVVKTSIHNKALIINDSVVFYKTSRLIFESYNPR